MWYTLEETHSCYNENMVHVIKNLTEKSMLLVASHNVDSVITAQKTLQEMNIKDNRVRFAQLKGFSDQLTGMLAQDSNLKVYKYLPYGPTETVMPYLVRRG